MPKTDHNEVVEASAPADQRTVLTQRRTDRFARVAPKGRRVYTARERAEMLVDEGSFVEMAPMRSAGAGAGSGVVAGWG
ncbi:MAG: hypothetical protein ABWX71_06410, partial [Aeromicrobium sp.]